MIRHVPTIAAVTLLLLAPRVSHAHFVLKAPPAVSSQDVLGSPQKLAPCGDEPGATPTGIVTPFHPGDRITVTIDEIIPHPGHYRIALATDRSLLPPEPIVTEGSTACGSAPIDPAPVYPVLADGLFVHTEPLTEPQTVEITLPSDVTCDHCTLQIIEFMSNHALNDPGGCYYHHCADISIKPGNSEPKPATGCTSAGAGSAVALLSLLLRRRRFA